MAFLLCALSRRKHTSRVCHFGFATCGGLRNFRRVRARELLDHTAECFTGTHSVRLAVSLPRLLEAADFKARYDPFLSGR